MECQLIFIHFVRSDYYSGAKRCSFIFKFQGEKLEGTGGIEWRVKVRVEPQVSAAGMNERRMAVTVKAGPACVCSI